MKTLVIGDLHLKPSNIETFKMFHSFLMRIIQEKQPDNLVYLGDIYDNKNIMYGSVHNCFCRHLEEISNHISQSIILIAGNHDYVSTAYDEVAFDSVRNISDKICIITPSMSEFKSKNVSFVPYNIKENIEKIIRDVCEETIVYGHFGLNGFYYNNSIIAEHEADSRFIKADCLYILGHFHGHQQRGPVLYLGTPWSQNFGEANQKKYVAMVDDAALKFEKIEVDGLPKHIVLPFCVAADLKNIDKLKSHYIRIDDVPVSEKEIIKNKFAECPNLIVNYLIEHKQKIRMRAENGVNNIIEEYIQNHLPSKFSCDKEECVKKCVEYMEK